MSLSNEEQNAIISIWEKTIEVQMHFNDISIRIRSLFITVLLALVGAIGWSLDKNYSLQLIDGISVNFAILLLSSGVISAYLFWFIDKHWYHKLLVGAVNQTLALDKEYGDKIPALGLTTSISGASKIVGFGNTIIGKALKLTRIVKSDSASFDGQDLRSSGKIDLFYKTPILLMKLVLLLSFFLGGITLKYGDGTVEGSILTIILERFN